MSGDEYGISTAGNGISTAQYRRGGESRWSLTEAAEIAVGLLGGRSGSYVSVGNGDHEFRLWANSPEYVPSNYDQTPTGPRWAAWYVDVAMVGKRWVYRPLADIGDYEEARNLADELADLPMFTRDEVRDDDGEPLCWIGASDGSETYEH